MSRSPRPIAPHAPAPDAPAKKPDNEASRDAPAIDPPYEDKERDGLKPDELTAENDS
jgi:hypothetical protein